MDPARATPQSCVIAVRQQGAAERISLLVGHKSTLVTELVYRQQIRPVLQDGAAVMDSIFGAGDE